MEQSREQFLTDRYKILSQEYEFSGINFPIPFIPNPNQLDYQTGQIIRYFCKKVGMGNGIIFEIFSNNFNAINSNSISIYITTQINWKISGLRNNIIKNNRVDIEGVEEYNKRQLISGDVMISGLKNKLIGNLTQFWRGF